MGDPDPSRQGKGKYSNLQHGLFFVGNKKQEPIQRSVAAGRSPSESGDERVIMDLIATERFYPLYRRALKLNDADAKCRCKGFSVFKIINEFMGFNPLYRFFIHVS